MYIITKWTESVDFTLHLRGEHSMIINYKLQIEHIKKLPTGLAGGSSLRL